MTRRAERQPEPFNEDERKLFFAHPSERAAGEPLTVRIRRAVELTGIGRSKMYELIAAGEIQVIKVGSSTLVIFSSLKAFVARRRGLLDPPVCP